MDASQRQRLIDNLAAIRAQMQQAAESSGRNIAEIRLIGVTKYVTSELARELFLAGVEDLAESRPQGFWGKRDDLADLPVRWHFIGHLQRNKLHRTVPGIRLLHSGDSWRLLAELDSYAREHQSRQQVLLEVNTSGDASKHGFQIEEMRTVVTRVAELTHVEVQGLMTMAALEGGPDVALRNFTTLRQLRDELQAAAPSNVHLQELSMGMSDDFELAIAAGSTMVRIGSALFEGIL